MNTNKFDAIKQILGQKNAQKKREGGERDKKGK